MPRLGLSYADLLPVHHLWLQYMENVLCDHLGKELPAVHDPGYENFSLLLMKVRIFGDQKRWKVINISIFGRLTTTGQR